MTAVAVAPPRLLGTSGNNIAALRYPFREAYPGKALSQVRWKLNAWKDRLLPLLNLARARLTVVDGFGAPGDALLTACVIRNIKERFPNLRINCITPFPELLQHDPNVESLNAAETFFSIVSWYLDLRTTKAPDVNVLECTLGRLGFKTFEYKARFYLSAAERQWGEEQIAGMRRPLISVNCHSKEEVKNWPRLYWEELMPQLQRLGSVIQLGDGSEPRMEGVTRFAGEPSLRESAAVLSQADLHIGPDSFLAHLANGLDVPSVIIFGGAHTPANLGYRENVNLYREVPCGPCWIQSNHGEKCPNDIRCLREIGVDEVLAAAKTILCEPVS